MMFFKLCLLFFTSTVMAEDLKFKDSFLFGLASAPAHAEDQLDDIWKDWAEQKKIRAFDNTAKPLERLQFWSHSEIEINLAAQTGIQIYRMGIDWGRIQPEQNKFDEDVIQKYKSILQKVKSKNIKVMMTLMHHSVPKWAQAEGGWNNPNLKKSFFQFSQRMIDEMNPLVDYWITFNEANVFISLSQVVGIWPPGEKSSPLSMMALGPFNGKAIKAMDLIADTHNEIYQWAHQKYPSIQMGIAHNMAYYTSKSFFGKMAAWYMDRIMNWRLPEHVKKHVDFFGFNYYGAEWIKGSQIDIDDPEEEYSEAGRAIYPMGLKHFLEEAHRRYPSLPLFITENGISDETDILRPAYLVEHLKVVHKAQEEGINILGYIFWTLSDNMEWADGYCPKFGLVAVDREQGLKRRPRASYDLFSSIVQSKKITQAQINEAHHLVAKNLGKSRPFCRGADGVTPLDTPTYRPIRWKIGR